MEPELSPSLRDALQRYAALERARFGARLRFVRLFGSFSRGDAHEESDIDVAVVVDDLQHDEWLAAVGDAGDVLIEMEVALSPFVVSSQRFDELLRRERRIARDILAEGLVIG